MMRNTPTFPRTVLIAAAAIVAADAMNELLAAHSQTPDTKPPAFEVASVKPNTSGDWRISMTPQPGGRLSLTNVPLKMLILNAYRVQEFQIVGGPDSVMTARFDVLTKAEGNPTLDEMLTMLQTLLADRFKLVVHHDTRELAIYALVLARADGKVDGKLKRSEADCIAGRSSAPSSPAPLPSSQVPQCGFTALPGTIHAKAVSMTAVAGLLPAFLGRVVLDKTGLSGVFDFDLTWTPDRPFQAPSDAPPLPPIDPNGPSIFTAVQDQLGLKLESTKGPVAVLVIDHAEQPTPD
jgi:uncharacterized protein (TIGR03435 family)